MTGRLACLRHAASRLRSRRRETQIMRRARETQELYDLGVAMYRQRMRRENPRAAEAEIDALVQAWLTEPPRQQFLTRPPRKDDDDRR